MIWLSDEKHSDQTLVSSNYMSFQHANHVTDWSGNIQFDWIKDEQKHDSAVSDMLLSHMM